ncbi:MAG: AraC family transcriptional regulator [Phycisphaeraceae bacterium]|nr:AraC family transcriptional regulator [Phycisphaeraceae bacterium]
MKPVLEKLTTLEHQYSFVLQKDSYEYYPTPWHYHPEYELVLVTRSEGTRIIGDNIEPFKDGDLAFIGPNLPHVYKNSQQYFQGNPSLRAEAIVIHFRQDFLGRHFFQLPEMSHVVKLLENSQQGLKILGKTRQYIALGMKKMLTMSAGERLIHLLHLIEYLSRSREYRLLANPGYLQKHHNTEAYKMTKIYDYILSRFRQPINLEEISDIAGLTPPSFCRFFKSRTRKTFTQFLNEIRVGYACKLMSDESLNISNICFESGFNNLSNFNRQFKSIVHQSPLQYRKTIVSGT